MTKRNFWADFFIAVAVCFVNLIIFRLLFLLMGVVPYVVVFLIIAALLAVEAVVFTKRTGRTVMFSVTSLIYQFFSSLTLVIYSYCLFDGIISAEADSTFATVMQLLGGLFTAFGVMVMAILTVISCIAVFLVTIISSLITKAVMNKKTKSSGVPQIETTGEDLQ